MKLIGRGDDDGLYLGIGQHVGIACKAALGPMDGGDAGQEIGRGFAEGV